MSVRKGDRAEGKLQVLNKARELKKYSLTIVKNDKHFPKSTRWLYAYPIVNEVRAACTCIRHAKQRRKLKKLYAKERSGEYAPGTTRSSLYSWLANADRGDTYYMQQKMLRFYKELEDNYNAK